MKILFLADIHSIDIDEWRKFLEVDRDKFDLIITLGDIDRSLLKSLVGGFEDKDIVGVLGNHDRLDELWAVGITNMHNLIAEISEDIKTIYGLSGSVRYSDKKDRSMFKQEEIVELLDRTDRYGMIVSHNSPFGIHDDLIDDTHVGYIGLRTYIEENSPKYCVHGHQHKNIVTVVNETTVIGVYGGIILNTETNEIERILELE